MACNAFLRCSIGMLAMFFLAASGCQSTALTNFDPKTFGARGDGKALDTVAINRAIDAAHAAGGGSVHLSAGTYLCHSIRLQSNVKLYLDPGATILGAEAPKSPASAPAYDQPEANPFRPFAGFGQSHARNSLLWGADLENVSIEGPGLIDGGGQLFRDQGQRPFGVANKAIAIRRCRNVLIRDVTIRRGGHFAILCTGVDNLTVDNVRIDTDRDGMDYDCCRNVSISNCTVNTPNDDAICLKSTYTLGIVRPTENVSITNCHVSGYEEGSVLNGTYVAARNWIVDANGGPMGRIKLGTESVGGFRNISISNCTFDTCHGLAFIDMDGGPLENVAVTNIIMRHVVHAPFFFRLGDRHNGPPGTGIGAIRRANISNVVVDDDQSNMCALICGIPGHDVQDITFRDIRIVCQGGETKAQASTQPAEMLDAYPEPNMFGDTPAYAFFIRHARNIDLHNVRIECIKADARPPFVLNDVKSIRFESLSAQHDAKVPVMVLRKVQNLSIRQSPGLDDRDRFSSDGTSIVGMEEPSSP